MKQTIIALAILLGCSVGARAIDNTTVEIVYSGTTATVNVASNISSYVTVNSGTSSHVSITQSSSFTPGSAYATDDNTTGEIIYVLSGTTTDGEFYLTAPAKCTVKLDGLTLTNASSGGYGSGAAITIMGGKRYKLAAKNETESTINDCASGSQKGCVYAKGHLEIQGKGVLNAYGNAKHCFKSTEYMSVKNLTLNIPSAAKDGMHCDEYFLMESGTVTISNVGGDGIQVEIDTDDTQTGEIAETANTSAHEDENSGYFYMEAGKLSISNVSQSSTTGTYIEAEAININGGTYTHDGTAYTGIKTTDNVPFNDGQYTIYDLQGRKIAHGTSVNSTSVNGTSQKGLYIINRNNKTTKALVK